MVKSEKLSRRTRWTYGIIGAAPLFHVVTDWPNLSAWVLAWAVIGGWLLYCAVIGTGRDLDWKWVGERILKRRHPKSGHDRG